MALQTLFIAAAQVFIFNFLISSCDFVWQPNLVEKLIVEDISPSFSVVERFPECIAAMKRISFRPLLKNIVRARKYAGEQLCEVIPVIPFLFEHV